MKVCQIALLLALAAGVGAQSDSRPEIRGTVSDPALNLGVTGAEITLFEFLLDTQKTVVRTQIATASTDTQGEFRFPLQHFGNFYVEGKKDGYSVPIFGPPSDGTGTAVTLDRNHPQEALRFSLTRLGEITGRVVDEDGNPVPGLHVVVQNPRLPEATSLGPGALTEQDGSFAVNKLPAGEYVVRFSPKAGDYQSVTTRFSVGDLKVVDQDVSSSPSARVLVSSGATSSVGTMTVGKVPYYRAHVLVSGVDCQSRQGLSFSAISKVPPATLSYDMVPCGSEFLVGNLKPGSYWFTLRDWKPEEDNAWGIADVEITRENVEVSFAVTHAAQINGRITSAEGTRLPKFQSMWIMMRARMDAVIAWSSPVASPNAKGQFTVRNLPWLPHDVSVQGLSGEYYVREIRYNGVPVTDGLVRLTQGAPAQNLEIVLDDQPATITGSVRDGDTPVGSPFIVAVKWPFIQGDIPVTGDGLKGDPAAHFQISGLAPGEYRVMAFNKLVRFTELSTELLSRAEKVTLERGSLKDISLKLIDPAQ